MNISIPIVECFVRLEFMNAGDSQYRGEYTPCQIFGMASIPGQTPLFHILCDDGGMYNRLPVHAFTHLGKQTLRHPRLEELCIWDCPSYHVSVVTYDHLKYSRMLYHLPDGSWNQGNYRFTLDWFADAGWSHGFAEIPGQAKCGHVLELEDGNFAIAPNNRLRVLDPNFVTRSSRYPRKLARQLFSAEGKGTWGTEDSEEYHYALKESCDPVCPAGKANREP